MLNVAAAGHQRVFVSYGVCVGIRSDSEELLERMTSALPPDATLTEREPALSWFSLMSAGSDLATGGRYGLYENDTQLAEGFRVTPLIEDLVVALRRFVAHHASDRLFVHAGAVAWRDCGIVIPGRSASGKTTLVAALVRAGATYYSDDYAVIDLEGQLHPYARPLSFRKGEYRRMRQDAVEHLGGSVATKAVPVRILVSCVYEPGADWSVTERSSGDGVQAMLANCLVARERPELALSVLSRASATALVLAGVRGESDSAASELLHTVDIFLDRSPSIGKSQ